MIAAVLQLNSSGNVGVNLSHAERLIGEAAWAGAGFIATPEATPYLGPISRKAAQAEPLDGYISSRFASMARAFEVYLLLGSFNESSPEVGKCYNTSVLYSPEGEILAVYRKIHLFDVDIKEGPRVHESALVLPGKEIVVADEVLGGLGLSICYDLRFGELYRKLVDRGAKTIAVPAAFTAKTGRAHWEVLLRARAIESQCYILAPAQFGPHSDEHLKESYGHAMIIDPWGRVLSEVESGEGFAIANIDLDLVDAVRAGIPLAAHHRI
ncbi:MAG: hydrolase [Deltaproteobacteria bacterium]|nr:MAG: hydrolase [Deltaproteobacteria bacterium]